MMLQCIIQRNIGWTIDEIRQNFPRIGLSTVFVAKNVKTLLDPDDTPLSKKVGDLISGASVILETVQKRLVVELLLSYFLSDRLDHSEKPVQNNDVTQ